MKAIVRGALVGLMACGPVVPESTRPTPHVSAKEHATQAAAAEGPPMAKKIPVETSVHGQKRVDDYDWMRKKGTPEVESYLQSENAFTAAQMKHTEPAQKKIYDELFARMKQDDATPPFSQDGWLYYERVEAGKQYAIHCRKKGDKGKEEILLDVNELGKNEKFISVEGLRVSDDGNSLVYLVDTQGFRQYTLRTKDLKTGKDGSEKIPRVDAVEFAKDNKTIFYVTEDEQTKRANKAFRHVIGEDAAKDTLVYEEKDERFDLGVDRTLSKAYVILQSQSRTTSEARIIDASKPLGAPVVVAPREQDHEYDIAHRGDTLYIRTNSGGRNFRIVTAPVSNPSKASWKELVPHRPSVMLENMEAFSDHLTFTEREGGLPQIAIYDYATKTTTRVPQPETSFATYPTQNREFDSHTFRFRYTSLKTPVSWVDYDIKTKTRTVIKKKEVPTYDESQYETTRIEVTARDGVKVPVSIVAKKGTKPDGTHPLSLYAYGSYGIPMDDTFDPSRVSLLDRGFVYAIAHIRGGGDLGKTWHDQGRMMTKLNTFHDFIDVAESLTKQGWAKPHGIVASGGSAGGLLMGGVANMKPEAFEVIMAYVPFVDVINTMLDESLPLTVNEFEEWGNPKKKPEYDYMMQYSPYDNVKAQAYPTMLVRSSYNDSQVMYWEPAKWVAKLRTMKTDKNPLLFKIAMEPAGHGGQSGRFDRLKDTAFDYAFILDHFGIQP